MGIIDRLYGCSLALLTDLYELTMGSALWKEGIAERESVFHLVFRKNPFGGGFTIAGGLAYVIEMLEAFRFESDDLAYLASLKGADQSALFEPGFLETLRDLRFCCDVDAVPEGTVVFAQEPLLRVRGPILQCQLIETLVLNTINFQSLIATKAARVCMAADGEPVLEFGLRRAHGVDGGVAASRAAYIGGCAATSNVLAGKLFGIPVRGTHAHSWIMAFDNETSAFESFARAMPNNCIFLVDTYDTLEGVRRAIDVGRQLRSNGYEFLGIRLDSGDLAYLSIEARRMLDDAGFPEAVIVASNDLDEHIITSLKAQGARIGVWGVGTKLATAYDQPALGGVYKLTALRENDQWRHVVKLSEQAIKISTPGIQQIRRFKTATGYVADAIYDTTKSLPDNHMIIVDPLDLTRRREIPAGTPYEDLLVPAFRGGRRVYDAPSMDTIRAHAHDQLQQFHPGIKRFAYPHQYPVGLEKGLFDLKTRLVMEARGVSQ
jgi:nicotinate phosphoribosyltransferase